MTMDIQLIRMISNVSFFAIMELINNNNDYYNFRYNGGCVHTEDSMCSVE